MSLSASNLRFTRCAGDGVFFFEQFHDRLHRLGEDLAEVYLVALGEHFLEGAHEVVFDLGGEVDLDYAAGYGLAHLVVRDAG